VGISRSDLTTVVNDNWVAAARVSAESMMVATGTIFDPNSTDTTWVDGVGQVTTPATLGTGKMRLQPIRSATAPDGKRIQAVQVSVPLGFLSVPARVGLGLTVTSSPFNHDLETYVYTCIEVADSSNPVERTMIFSVNHGLRV